MLRQRQPRQKDARHLDFIRSLPCAVCKDNTGTEAAHIRIGALEYGKRTTGMGEKPSDKWSIPLCNKHHREQHDAGDEWGWWESYGIDPFMLAITLKERS